MQKRKDTGKNRASRRNFMKGLAVAPALPLLGGEEGTNRPPGTSSTPAPGVFQPFVESHVPNEPFEWLIPKRYGLYMRHQDDYVKQFVNDKLEPPHTGNLFNADSRMLFGVADSPYIGMIWPDGAIGFEGVPGFGEWMFTEDSPCSIRFLPNNPVLLKQYLVNDYLPFIATEWSYQSLARSLKAVVGAVSYRGRVLYTLNLNCTTGMSFQLANAATYWNIPSNYRLAVHLTGAEFQLRPDGRLLGPGGAFGKCIGEFQKRGQVLSTERPVGSPDQWIVLSAGQPLSDEDVRSLDAATVERLVNAQHRTWDEFLAQGAQYDVPIPLIGEAYRSSMIVAKIVQRRISKDSNSWYVTLAGATIYRRYWWRDNSLMLRALDINGFHNEAAYGLRLATSSALPEEVNRLSAHVNIDIDADKVASELGNLCRYQLAQRADGSWTAPPGQWDGTGLALYALSSHYLIMRVDEWLTRALPFMEKGARFLLRARVGTPEFQEWIREFWPAYAAVQKYAAPWDVGLLPGGGGEGGSDSAFKLYYRPRADENELRELAKKVPLQSYNHDFFAVAGLRTYARVLKESGKGDPGPYLKAIDEYVEALEKSIRQTIKRFGLYWIPAGPDGHVKLALIGSVLYPGRVFPPDHPLINGTFRYFAAQDKLNLAPNEFYGTHPDRWSFTQWFMINGQLLRGEYGQAQQGFDTYLRCMWLPGSWRENFREPHSRYAFGEQPDVFNALLYTEMVRNFLLREEGSDILIADGMHHLWLPAGKSVSVRNAPTEFGGVVSYSMRRSNDGKTIALEITNEKRGPRKFVWTPRGFGKIVSAKLNGRPYDATSGSTSFRGPKNIIDLKFN